MSSKIGIGGSLPPLTISVVSGGTLDLPDGLGSGYKAIIFYRGHW